MIKSIENIDINKGKNAPNVTDYPVYKVFSGPGGNYLSNEIFYRVARLREVWIAENTTNPENPPSKPTGHFHIEMLQEIIYDIENKKFIYDDFSASKTNNLLSIVKVAIKKGVE